MSPRASREFDNRIHDGSRAELINIGSSKSSSNDPAARYERDRDRDRPSATPFVMGGSYGNSGPGSGRSMRTPPPVSGPTQPRASSRALEDAFRMPPSSSTSVGYLGDAVHHPSSPRRYSQSLQGPPLPGSSSSSSSSRPPPPPRPSGLSGLSPPLHRTLPPPNNNSSSAFGGGSNGASRYGPNPPALNGQSPMMAGGSGLGARAPTPSRSPVLVRAERDRIPSPPPNKMMVGAMMNGPPPPSSYSNSSRTTTPTVASDEKSGLRNDSPFFASISNPAPPYANKPSLSVHHPSKGDSERDSKVDKLPARISPPPVLAPPPSVLPPIPTQPKSERVQGL
ncbi:hypothetical protein C8F01DRAFT_1261688 [Mycena amicta]|nr:hypothetical protein C8F01DRAFT_1261688 [Mycena amicta]